MFDVVIAVLVISGILIPMAYNWGYRTGKREGMSGAIHTMTRNLPLSPGRGRRRGRRRDSEQAR